MIDRDAARRIAADYLATIPSSVEVVMLDDATREYDFGWVFFYQSRVFLETRDELDALVGNAPIIVDRHDGSVQLTGTARPLEHYIREHRRRRGYPRRTRHGKVGPLECPHAQAPADCTERPDE